MPARQLFVNRAAAASAVLTASSEQPGFPRRRVQDQSPAVTWRSKLGWNIVAGVNDKIDFSRGGVKAATVAAGNYATPALMGAAVVAALEAADPTPVWGYGYGSNTFWFTSDLAFSLLFGSGANKATSIARELAFTETDKAAATTQTAEDWSFKSREWLKVDLGAALAVQCGVALGHNLGAAGTMRLQGHGADTAAGWANPDVNQPLAGGAACRVVYFGSGSKRYWRLLIDDVSTNQAGYSELALWWIGPHDDPSITYSHDYSKVPDQLSGVAAAISGAHQVDVRPQQWVHRLAWVEVPEADLNKLLAWIAAAPRGRNSFLVLDPANAPTALLYGYFDGPPGVALSGNLYWTVTASFREALA